MSEKVSFNIGLRIFSKLTCLSTLFLIFVGAMVNSTGSGLAVPDWPTSYGYWFFVPMVGGVFYEHGHRLIAEGVGILTLILFIWVNWFNPLDNRRWLKKLTFFALITVILQGILGGITVLMYLPTAVSVAHGVLAQSFFVLMIIIAYSFSAERESQLKGKDNCEFKACLKPACIFSGLIFIQLILGAIMRHSGSGLAIYDFPTMAGEWLPRFDKDMLWVINDWRFNQGLDPVNMLQVVFHCVHRLWALIIVIYLMFLNSVVFFKNQTHHLVRGLLVVINILIFFQIIMGVLTILTQKHAHVTSFHVLLGAVILGLSVILILRILFLKGNPIND